MQRKRSYLQLLRYWNHFLEEQRIGLFLSYTVPHFDEVYVLYGLCRQKDIPVVMCDAAQPLPDATTILADWKYPAPGLRERFDVLCQKENWEEFRTLPDCFERYFQSQRKGKPEERKPWYCRSKIFLRPPWSISPLRSSFLKRQLQSFVRTRRARTMSRFYDDHTTQPDFTKKYIYVPLHMQPECSTCPLASVYVQQELVVQMLGALVPNDVLIYVKEHPFQYEYRPNGMCRSLAFYHDLLAVRNVRLISREVSTYSLITHACAVAVGTGTAGFEALFQEKPVLMFGYRYHQYAPGVFAVRTVDDCACALHSILHEGRRPAIRDIRLFLHSLGDIAAHGYADLSSRPSTELSDEENATNMGIALRKAILEILPPIHT